MLRDSPGGHIFTQKEKLNLLGVCVYSILQLQPSGVVTNL